MTFDADCTFGIKWCSRTLLIGRTSYSSFAVVRKWAAAAPLKDGSLDLYQMIMSSTLLFCHLLRCCPFHIFVQSFQLANVECFSNKLVFPAGIFWNCHSFFFCLKKRPAWKEHLILKQNKAHCKNTYMVQQSVFISLHQFYVWGLIPQMEGTRNQI